MQQARRPRFASCQSEAKSEQPPPRAEAESHRDFGQQTASPSSGCPVPCSQSSRIAAVHWGTMCRSIQHREFAADAKCTVGHSPDPRPDSENGIGLSQGLDRKQCQAAHSHAAIRGQMWLMRRRTLDWGNRRTFRKCSAVSRTYISAALMPDDGITSDVSARCGANINCLETAGTELSRGYLCCCHRVVHPTTLAGSSWIRSPSQRA